MGKQQGKKAAATPDQLFVFGVDDAGKARGARFAEFNDKIVSAAAEMKLTSVHPASAAFTEIAMKLPPGRLYASGKAFVPPIKRDLFERLNGELTSPGDDSQASKPAATSAPVEAQESAPEEPNVRVAGLSRSWDGVGVGHVVLAHESPEDGWWECVVVKREDGVLTLRLRDYPKQGKYIRHLKQVALIHPGPE